MASEPYFKDILAMRDDQEPIFVLWMGDRIEYTNSIDPQYYGKQCVDRNFPSDGAYNHRYGKYLIAQNGQWQPIAKKDFDPRFLTQLLLLGID